MVDPSHKRIGGMHVCDDGSIAVVWLSHDTLIDEITVNDACIFKSEVPVVIAEGINARGRHIPIAWGNKEFSDQLLDRGCRMLPEKCDDSNATAEVISREIWERIRSLRLKVDRRLKNWHDEATTLERADGKIPVDSHPLMAATRNAMQMIKFAKKLQPRKTPQTTTRKLGII